MVATNNYVRQGGDGYKVFADKAQNAYDYGPGLEQVVADYLGANRPYTPKLEGRITEVAQAAQPAEATPPAEAAAPAETTTAPAEAATPPAETAPATPELPAASGDIANTPPTVQVEPAPAETQPAPAETQPAQAEPAPAAEAPAQAAAGETEHVVVAGDNYWDLAESFYKDGEKWKLIADANPDYKPEALPIGVTLKIPAAQ
jgi:5'-nucleotidase